MKRLRRLPGAVLLGALVLVLPATASAVLSHSVGIDSNTFTAATLAAPTGVTATCSGLGQVTISWTAASLADGYFIYRTTIGGPSDVLLNATRDPSSPYVDSGSFSVLTSYTYRVKSAKATNWTSDFSNTSATRTMALGLVCT